jgi:hypothetical protein
MSFLDSPINLPVELIEKILDCVTDNGAYKNCRLVCKHWYNYLKLLKKFKNNKLTEYLEFNNDVITGKNNYDKVIMTYRLNLMGNSVLKRYNDRGILIKMVTVNLPKYIKVWTLENNIVNTKYIDIGKNKVEEDSFPFMTECAIL